MLHVHDLMTDKAIRRYERWNTEVTEILPPPEWLNEPTIVSRYSRTGLTTKRRYLLEDILVRVNQDIRETPSAVARDYLFAKYKHSPKWTSSQRDRVLSEIVDHPLYCKPTTFDNGAYIDIASAYWSVMVRVGWDCNYYPAKWLGIATPPLDFPYSDNKRARNCLVSVARATKFNMWSPDKGSYFLARGNPRANSQLYCLIQDCLNGIACEVIEAGAVYVFTDGYIAPTPKVAHDIIEIIYSWGFFPRIHAEGDGFVNALGSYTVGNKRTRNIIHEPAPYESVKQLEYHNWLRSKMEWTRSVSPWHDNFCYKPIRALRYLG